MGISQFDETIAFNSALGIVAGVGLAAGTLVIGNPRAIRLDVCFALNNDVIDHHVRLILSPNFWSAGDLGAVTVPAGAGYTTGPPVDVFAALFGAGSYLVLDNGDYLSAAVQEAVTLTNVVTVQIRGGQV